MPETSGPEYYSDLKKTSIEGGHFKLHESEKDPNLVVKTPIHDGLIPEAVLLELAHDIQEFSNKSKSTRLTELLPKSQVVIGKNSEGKTSFSVIMEKINGRKLIRKELTASDKQSLVEAVNLFVDSYLQTYSEGKGYTLEFEMPENFMLGTKASELLAEPKLYFVDTYPVYKIPISEMLLKIDDFSESTGIQREQLEPAIAKLKQFEASND